MSAIAIASGGSALTPATGNINLFVSTTGSDSNPGTALLPFATIQHAVNVLSTFSYGFQFQGTANVAAGTYHENVEISGGLFHGLVNSPQSPSGFIIGDIVTPTNVKVAPNLGLSKSHFDLPNGGNWLIDGFSFVADGTQTGSPDFITTGQGAALQLGTVDFDGSNITNVNNQYSAFVAALDYSGIEFGNGNGTGIATIHGSSTCPVFQTFFNSFLYSTLGFGNSIVFNTAWNIVGIPVLRCFNGSRIDISPSQFINPPNITGGFVAQLVSESGIFPGADPSASTWPSGPFSNSKIDATCSVDGFIYSQSGSGTLVDQSTIYRGTYQVYKNNSDSSVNFVYDGGTGKLGFPAIPYLILANDTNPEGILVYNTVDNPYNPTNYERGIFDWNASSNLLTIGSQAHGTGTARNVTFKSAGGKYNFPDANGGGNQINFGANGVIYSPANAVWIFETSSNFFVGISALGIGLTANGDTYITRTAASVVGFGSVSSATAGFIQWGGQARVTSDFNVASNTTLANVTGLTVNLSAGRTYSFEAALLMVTGASAGGIKIALGGTATVTNLIADAITVDGTTEIAGTQVSALGTNIVANTNAGTTPKSIVKGTITVNAAGTFTVQFAQNAPSITNSTVKQGSYILVHDMP